MVYIVRYWKPFEYVHWVREDINYKPNFENIETDKIKSVSLKTEIEKVETKNRNTWEAEEIE